MAHNCSELIFNERVTHLRQTELKEKINPMTIVTLFDLVNPIRVFTRGSLVCTSRLISMSKEH